MDRAEMCVRASQRLDAAPIGFDKWQEQNIIRIMVDFADEQRAPLIEALRAASMYIDTTDRGAGIKRLIDAALYS